MYQDYDTLMHDITFKESFADIHNRRQLEHLLEMLLEYPKGSLKDKLSVSYESQVKKSNVLEKNSRTDIIVNFDDTTIDIEAYRYLDKESVDKSTLYVMKISSSNISRGVNYKDTKVIQYNFVDNVKTNVGPDIINKFHLAHEKYPDIVISLDRLKIYYVRVDKLNELGYNINEELLRWLKFIVAVGYDNRQLIAEGDELLMEFNEWIDNYVNDDVTKEAMAKLNKEIEENKYVKIAREEGHKEEKVEIAKSLLTSTLTIEEIAKHTGLSIEEIESLKK